MNDEDGSDILQQEQHQYQELHHRPSNPLDNATFLSRCSFSYAFPLLKLGKERPIEECDLPALDELETSTYNRHLIENIWDEEAKRANSSLSKRKKNLARAVFWYYLKSTWMAEILMMANISARIGQAIVLGLLMEQFGRYEYNHQEPQEQSDIKIDVLNVRKSYLYAALLTLCGLIAFPSKQQQFFQTYRKGVQLRLGFVAAIYSKTLRLPSVQINSTTSDKSASSSNSSSGNSISSSNPSYFTSGHVTNLVSNDVEKFLLTSVMVPFLIQGPFVAIVILVVGIVIVGPVFATGYGLLLILVPFQTYLGRRFVFLRSKVASLTDERVTMVSQAVSGVRVMKMNVSCNYYYECLKDCKHVINKRCSDEDINLFFSLYGIFIYLFTMIQAWELEFEQRISKLRSKEVSVLLKASQFRALNESFYFFSATVISVFIFIIDVLIGGILTPRKIFTTLTLMSIIQFILTKNL